MIKTQVQLPDELYYKAKAIAEQREWSLAEVVTTPMQVGMSSAAMRSETRASSLANDPFSNR